MSLFFNIEANNRRRKAYHIMATEPFRAITFEKKLYPVTYQSSEKNEAFIYGVGWKKRKNAKLIPPLSINYSANDLNEYMKEYGENCLFYALTKKELRTNAICDKYLSHEFIIAKEIGFETYGKFIRPIIAINEKISKVIKDKYDIDSNKKWCTSKYSEIFMAEQIFFIEPTFTLMRGQLLTQPYIDVIKDDNSIRIFRNRVFPDKDETYSDIVCMKDFIEAFYSKEIAEDYNLLIAS